MPAAFYTQLGTPKWRWSGSWRKLDIYLIAEWEVSTKNRLGLPVDVSVENYIDRPSYSRTKLSTRRVNVAPNREWSFKQSAKVSMRKLAWKILTGKSYYVETEAEVKGAPLGIAPLTERQTVKRKFRVKK